MSLVRPRSRLAIQLMLATGIAASTLCGDQREEHATDRARLLRDIEVLERRGVPGCLAVYGDEAFCVLTANQPPEAVAAAARHGAGRVFAIAHNGYLDAGHIADRSSSVSKLVRNTLHWLGDSERGLRIGLLGGDVELAQAIGGLGHEVERFTRLPAELESDVIVWRKGLARDPAAWARLRAFVAAGGGLLTAVCPWGYLQVNSARGYTLQDDLAENRVLAPMGLVFGGGHAEATGADGFAVAASRPERVHAGAVLERLSAGSGKPGEDAVGADIYLLERAIADLPLGDELAFWTALDALLEGAGTSASPRPDRPLGRDDVMGRLYVSSCSRRWKELAPEDVSAAGIDASFPGAVPPDAPRVERELTLSRARRGWQSTGLYLAPGDVLGLHSSGAAGWRLRIGCHKDRLWRKPTWKRWPEITHVIELADGEQRLATPFGGPLYFETTADAHADLRVTVAGAVEAPRFSLEELGTARSWSRSRKAPGPWAELEGRHIVLSVPSAVVRELDDPGPLLEWWDAVLISHRRLAGVPMTSRRERFVPDVQISAGYMHSGYPIMMQLDQVTPDAQGGPPPLLDLERLRREGCWGPLHELGHNLQRPSWTFAGTGEVTCNLFSLYSNHTVVGIDPWSHPWLEKHKTAGARYLEAGASFDEWRKQPGVALLMYAQLQHAFGWEPFVRVIGEYRDLSRDARPDSTQERIDEWMSRMSHATGKDLRPFFKHWGLPLGADTARDRSLDRLPEWLPDFGELEGE